MNTNRWTKLFKAAWPRCGTTSIWYALKKYGLRTELLIHNKHFEYKKKFVHKNWFWVKIAANKKTITTTTKLYNMSTKPQHNKQTQILFKNKIFLTFSLLEFNGIFYICLLNRNVAYFLVHTLFSRNFVNFKCSFK